ncbi:MAG TPA: superoxide dismutase [Alphaproteobacteria bacterium]|nr:superoxide dismutase [Alphaproteobacteria bacterium]
MAFELPPLPYSRNTLEPVMSEKTFSFHYDKHHQAYVTKLNELIKGKPEENQKLEDIIKGSHDNADKQALFNNSGQVWNHTFFWCSMKKGGGGNIPSELEKRLVSDFGSVDKFKEEFIAAGVGQFGSGWAWLVEDGGKLKIMKTANAHLPLAHGKKALLTCDVWEHAYYLDYQNRRPDFLKAFINDLVNWEFAAKNLTEGVKPWPNF